MIIASNTLLEHWFHYYFWGGPTPTTVNVWYERGVWGNVFADIPLAALALITGTIAFIWHKDVMERTHSKLDKAVEERQENHDELLNQHQKHHDEIMLHLKKVIDSIDPESEGKISDVLDRLDPSTEGGIKVIVDKLNGKD